MYSLKILSCMCVNCENNSAFVILLLRTIALFNQKPNQEWTGTLLRPE